MLTKLSFQKVVAVIMSIIIFISLILGIMTRTSYLSLSRNDAEISKASLQISEELCNEHDYIYSTVNYDAAVAELDQSNYIFYAKCVDRDVCFGCIKYKMSVIKTIKGEVDETSKEVILYQLVSFDFSKQGVTFISPDNSLPLKTGNEYLIFANKRDYYKDYQQTLDTNEYSLSLSSSFPTAVVVDENQDRYIDISQVENYADIEDCYYMCFDEKSLNNINKISQQIIIHYLGSK